MGPQKDMSRDHCRGDCGGGERDDYCGGVVTRKGKEKQSGREVKDGSWIGWMGREAGLDGWG